MVAVIVHSLSCIHHIKSGPADYQLCILSLMYRGIGKKNLQSPCRRSNVLESGLKKSTKKKQVWSDRRKRRNSSDVKKKRYRPNSSKCQRQQHKLHDILGKWYVIVQFLEDRRIVWCKGLRGSPFRRNRIRREDISRIRFSRNRLGRHRLGRNRIIGGQRTSCCACRSFPATVRQQRSHSTATGHHRPLVRASRYATPQN